MRPLASIVYACAPPVARFAPGADQPAFLDDISGVDLTDQIGQQNLSEALAILIELDRHLVVSLQVAGSNGPPLHHQRGRADRRAGEPQRASAFCRHSRRARSTVGRALSQLCADPSHRAERLRSAPSAPPSLPISPVRARAIACSTTLRAALAAVAPEPGSPVRPARFATECSFQLARKFPRASSGSMRSTDFSRSTAPARCQFAVCVCRQRSRATQLTRCCMRGARQAAPCSGPCTFAVCPAP